METNTIFGAMQLLEYNFGTNSKIFKHSMKVAEVAEKTITQTWFKGKLDVYLKIIQAAMLHDIGHSKYARDTKFHPFDGYIYLKKNGWHDSICKAVLCHSFSKFIVPSKFQDSIGLVYDGVSVDLEESMIIKFVTYADMSVTSDGTLCNLEEKFRDIENLYGHHSIVYQRLFAQYSTAQAIIDVVNNLTEVSAELEIV